MRKAVFAKFKQHPKLKDALLSTGTAQLVQHSSKDRYWSDGGDETSLNMLGQILMEVRDKLASKDVYPDLW